MARARNIKPGLFSNDVLAEVQPLGRLLFIGLWTLADREGRLEDRPRRIKAEILPYDDCDVESLLSDLNQHGFIKRYAVGVDRFIQVVNFSKHQNPHVKESSSSIPAYVEPDASTVQAQCKEQPLPERAGLIPDSGSLIPDSGLQRGADPMPDPSPSAAQPSRAPKATRLDADWTLPADWLTWALQERPEWTEAYAHRVADQFRDYWCAKGGADARKVSWEATWRNWVRREKALAPAATNARPTFAQQRAQAEIDDFVNGPSSRDDNVIEMEVRRVGF